MKRNITCTGICGKAKSASEFANHKQRCAVPLSLQDYYDATLSRVSLFMIDSMGLTNNSVLCFDLSPESKPVMFSSEYFPAWYEYN
jgi:hypothetical protein